MTDPNISPLARRLAEENNVDWRRLEGTGADGKVVERDVLDYLARVMAGDEALDPTPEPLPEGMQAWPDAPAATDEPGAAGGADPFEETSVEAEDGGVFGSRDEDPSAQDEAGTRVARAPELHEDGGDVDTDADEAVAAEAGAEPGSEPGDEFGAGIGFDETDLELESDGVPSAGDDLTDTIDEGIFLFEDEAADGAAVAGGDADAPDDEIEYGDLGPLRDTSEDAIDPVLSGEFEVPESALDDAPDLFAADASDDAEDDLDDMGDGLLVGDETVATAEAVESGIDADLQVPERAPEAAFGAVGAVDEAGATDDPMQDRSTMRGLELDEVGEDASEADRFALRLEDDEQAAVPATDDSTDRGAWTMADDEAHDRTDEASDDALAGPRDEEIDDELVFGDVRETPDPGDAPTRDGPEFDFEDADEFGGIYVGESASDESEAPDPVHLDLGGETVRSDARGLEHEPGDPFASDAVPPEFVGPDAEDAASDPGDAAAAATHADADADFVEDMDAVADLDASDAAPELDLAALPLTTHGTLLRRHLDMTELADAQIALARELGQEEPVPPGAFLVRAAAKALRAEALGGGDRVAWAALDGGLRVRPIDGAADIPFGALIRAVHESDPGSSEPAAPALIVVDLSSHDVDEAVLHLEAPVLALGRVLYDTHAGRSRTTLSLSGDVAADAGARLLGRVAELLDAPVRLVL